MSLLALCQSEAKCFSSREETASVRRALLRRGSVTWPIPVPGKGRDGYTICPREAGSPQHGAAKDCCSPATRVPLLTRPYTV